MVSSERWPKKHLSAQKLHEAIGSILGTINSIDKWNEKRSSWNAHTHEIVVVVVVVGKHWIRITFVVVMNCVKCFRTLCDVFVCVFLTLKLNLYAYFVTILSFINSTFCVWFSFCVFSYHLGLYTLTLYLTHAHTPSHCHYANTFSPEPLHFSSFSHLIRVR